MLRGGGGPYRRQGTRRGDRVKLRPDEPDRARTLAGPTFKEKVQPGTGLALVGIDTEPTLADPPPIYGVTWQLTTFGPVDDTIQAEFWNFSVNRANGTVSISMRWWSTEGNNRSFDRWKQYINDPRVSGNGSWSQWSYFDPFEYEVLTATGYFLAGTEDEHLCIGTKIEVEERYGGSSGYRMRVVASS